MLYATRDLRITTPMTYRGILAKKIAYAGPASPRDATLLGRTDPAADAYYDAEIDKRLAALFRHYGIEPQLGPPPGAERVWDLMIELAFDHVPGLRVDKTKRPARARGRPVGRTAKDAPSYRRVFRDVERLRAERPALPVKTACAELKRRDRKTYGAMSVEAIRARYRAFEKLIGLARADIDAATKAALRKHPW
jgi:hypothetical protein